MDKQRARVKAKRREERRKAKAAEDKELAKAFNAKYKADGLKHQFKPKDIGSAYRQIQGELAEEAIIANTVAALYTMRRLYRFGAMRLHRLAGEIAVMITDVGKGRRSPSQLEDMLMTDARLDIKQHWSEQRKEFNTAAQRKELLCAYARQTATVQITAIFYTMFPNGSVSRRSRRMERVAESIANVSERILTQGKLDDYIAELAACGFRISKDGKFGSNKLDSGELEKLKRRIVA